MGIALIILAALGLLASMGTAFWNMTQGSLSAKLHLGSMMGMCVSALVFMAGLCVILAPYVAHLGDYILSL